MDIDYGKQLDEIRNRIEALENEYAKVKMEWVRKYHPLKVGDVVEITGVAYRGKQMRVISVGIAKSIGKYVWFANGGVLKKDGTPGFQAGRWEQNV